MLCAMDGITAANIAISDEKREEDLAKKTKSTVDYVKLDADIAAAKHSEDGVRGCFLQCVHIGFNTIEDHSKSAARRATSRSRWRSC